MTDVVRRHLRSTADFDPELYYRGIPLSEDEFKVAARNSGDVRKSALVKNLTLEEMLLIRKAFHFPDFGHYMGVQRDIWMENCYREVAHSKGVSVKVAKTKFKKEMLANWEEYQNPVRFPTLYILDNSGIWGVDAQTGKRAPRVTYNLLNYSDPDITPLVLEFLGQADILTERAVPFSKQIHLDTKLYKRDKPYKRC